MKNYKKIILSIIIIFLLVAAGFFMYLIKKDLAKKNADKTQNTEQSTGNGNKAIDPEVLKSISAPIENSAEKKPIDPEVLNSISVPVNNSNDSAQAETPKKPIDPEMLKSISIPAK